MTKEIFENNFILIKGSSGSGKSSFGRVLCAFDKPFSGNASLFQASKKISLNKNIFYLANEIPIYYGGILENITLKKFSRKKINKKLLAEVLKITEINNKLKALLKQKNKNFDLVLNKLSTGQLKKIGIARALYSDKKILFFDESFNNFDKNLKKRILNKIIKIKNKIIFIVDHNLNKQKLIANSIQVIYV